MKEIIHLYSGYDLWANTRMIERLQREDGTILDHPVKSSFSTLRSSVQHLSGAGNIWYQRLSGRPAPRSSEADDSIGSLIKQSSAMNDMVLGWDEQRLLERVDYTNLKGDPFTQPRWQLLMHVFNHATYHRGQLVTIMHQLELNEVPNTDMVKYQRSLMAGI